MPRFAANLSMMYNEVPFLQRFDSAARDGFRAVEFLFPYEHPAAEVALLTDGHRRVAIAELSKVEATGEGAAGTAEGTAGTHRAILSPLRPPPLS